MGVVREKLAQKLSVVIPTRNRAALLSVAIASALASPLVTNAKQIIVVDDDSTDTTAQVASDFDTSYVKVRCHGPSGSRNAGLLFSSTPYIAFLDDDDAWMPAAMTAQSEALEETPDAAFAYGQVQLASEELVPLDYIWPTPPLVSGFAPQRLFLNLPQIGAVLFRREVLLSAGGFNTSLNFGEDAETMMRVAARHPIVGVEAPTVLYRQQPPSMQRADYYWDGRAIVHWRPKNAGVGWKAFAQFEATTRGSFAWRFCQSAAWCAENGQRRDALICLYRALRISPPHTLLRQHHSVLSTLKTLAATHQKPPEHAY
jgi:glycosyltransferase involved in cell wall biosynthesis